MNNNLNRQLKTIMVPQFIAPAGKRLRDLKPFEIGLYDIENKKTVDVACYYPDKKFQIVYKTASKGADNPIFGDIRGAQLPIRSLDISRIDRAHLFDKATDEGKPFVAYLGYDGISACKTLAFPCGADYGLQITVRGEAVRNTFGQNLTEIVPFNTGCCDDCDADEKCEKTLDSIIKAVKSSSFYVKEYFTLNKVTSCCVPADPFPKKDYKKWLLTVCDNGGALDLASVQAQYPDYDIECLERKAPYTTYGICIACPVPATEQAAIDAAQAALDAAIDAGEDATVTDPLQAALDAAIATGATAAEAACKPADFKQSRTVQVECNECPCDFTLVSPAGTKHIACVDWPDITKDTSTPALALACVKAATPANPVVTAATSAKFLYCEGKQAYFEICVPEGTDLATSTTKLKDLGECAPVCQSNGPDIPWCPGGDAYKITSTQCLIMKLPDCDPATAMPILLEKVRKSLEGTEDVQIETLAVKASNNCMIEFTVDVCSQCLEDGCDTYGTDGAEFTKLPSFEGFLWKDCTCEGWTQEPVLDDEGNPTGLTCPTPPAEEIDMNCQCGLKFTGCMVRTTDCVPCATSIHDNVEREPLEIEVSIISQYDEEESGSCPTLDVDWTVVQFGEAPDGIGMYALRDLVTSREYDNYLYTDPKSDNGNLLRQRLGYEYEIDACKFYNHISLYHYYTRHGQSWHSASHGGNREMIKIYVEKDNVELLENLKSFFNATLLKGGVCNLL